MPESPNAPITGHASQGGHGPPGKEWKRVSEVLEGPGALGSQRPLSRGFCAIAGAFLHGTVRTAGQPVRRRMNDLSSNAAG